MSEDLLGELKGIEYDTREVADRIKAIDHGDAATVLELLPVDVGAEVAGHLEPDIAGEILTRADPYRAGRIIARMPHTGASSILTAMAPDDRVELLRQVDRPLHDELLRQFAPAQAAETRALELYAPRTAGGIMTTQVTALPENLSVDEAITELRRIHEVLGQISYVYVINEDRRLLGVLSMRDLILARASTPVSKIMIPNVRSVPASMDQEEVARLMRSSRFLALPVVDENARLVGLISLDDVVDVLQEEATEDVQRMFGAGAEERLTSTWRYSFSKRIWWLQVNLGTAFLAGAVVAAFGGTISRFAVLAIYIPIVSGMGSNAGAQAMSVAIRGITHGKTDRKLLRHVMMRETIVGFLSGAVAGITTALIAMIWQYQHGPCLGLIIGLSLIITQTLACISGAAIPFVMKRFGFDPAQSATIFTTTITDIAGFGTLLGLATLFAGWMR